MSVTPADLFDRLTSEGLLSLREVARKLKSLRGGRPVAPSTVYRWAMHGRRLPDGRTVRLEAVQVGGQFVTSWPAVRRFVADQQSRPAPLHCARTRTPTQRRRAAAEAEKELDRKGVK